MQKYLILIFSSIIFFTPSCMEEEELITAFDGPCLNRGCDDDSYCFYNGQGSMCLPKYDPLEHGDSYSQLDIFGETYAAYACFSDAPNKGSCDRLKVRFNTNADFVCVDSGQYDGSEICVYKQ